MCRATITKEKRNEAAQHREAVERFLASGGQPQQCPAQTFAKPAGHVSDSEKARIKRSAAAGARAAAVARRKL